MSILDSMFQGLGFWVALFASFCISFWACKVVAYEKQEGRVLGLCCRAERQHVPWTCLPEDCSGPSQGWSSYNNSKQFSGRTPTYLLMNDHGPKSNLTARLVVHASSNRIAFVLRDYIMPTCNPYSIVVSILVSIVAV